MLALGVGNAWGALTEAYSYTFTAKQFSDNATAKTLGSVKWTPATTWSVGSGYWGYDATKGQQWGSSKHTLNKMILTSGTSFTNVKKITINGSIGSSGGCKLSVKVGGTSIGTEKTLTTTATPYDFESATALTGVVEITLSNGTKKKAQYIKSITIYTDDTPVGATKYAVTIDPNIEHGTVTADVAEAAEGATVTLTAIPATGYKFDDWDVKDASSNPVTVDANGEFTMPASNVTVSASFVTKTQYTIKWNVVEGSVADTYVYEGDALGTLPTADNCSSGKVFVGWTDATSVNADGSSITYAKATDVPAGNKEYNAVYATSGGTADKVDELNLTLTGASGTTYSSWTGKKSVSDASYAGSSAGGNSAIQLRSTSNSGIITTTSGGKLKKVVVTWNSNTTYGRTLNVYGKNTAYTSTSELYADATAGTKIGTIVKGTSTTLEITDEYEYIGMRSNSGAMYLDEIEITWSSTSYIDYSLDCETRQEAYLTVAETELEFGTVAQNATVTETLNVSGGYLAEDVALTISGTNASFFSVSPATITKADEVNETVTVTYEPTEVGDHTATLTIKTGDITKEIALSGKVLAPGKWVLVKDVATLSAGDEIIIAAADADYAIGEAASNNYKGAAITKVGETANADAGVTVLKVEATGVAEAPYALKDGSKYLYAAGSDKNYLKAQGTNNVNGQWAITITAEGVASIEAAKSSNRKVMQYNPNSGSPIFACYETASQKALAIYRNSENVVKPVISGDADFTGSTQVTITAQSGLTVYYTTDGTDPDNTSTQYTVPFTINATITVKAIAYDASSNASGVAEMTFTKHDLVNVATAMALEEDEVAYFDEFEVVKVVAGKGNIYIKDASGHGLIYDNTLAGQLKDGDRVQGFVGISSPYSGLPEAKPYNVTYADLTITSDVAAEPYDFTSTAIAATDINKYVVFNDVAITTNTDVSTNPTLTIGGNSVKFYNQFGVSKTLEAGKIYDIYGFVAIYNSNLQVYFYEAAQDGEVIQKYTVTYNAGGATGTVPVDNAEYSEGAQVYLKSATGLTKEGYDYKGWKVTDEGGNEIAVSSNKFNMPASNVTVTAQWEEIVAPEIKDFSTGYWVLVTDVNKIADGDKIVIAAADENFAMKSYESGNNCRQVAVTKLGDQLLKWTSEIGVFQLAANGSNYTIQDVNTEEYLYAAGTGSNNYLKAADEVPADADAAKPYIWTISYTDGVATVKATSDNRNTLMYNTGSDLFSCYEATSSQKDIALYKYVTELPAPTPDYTRTVTKGDYGTICLEFGSSNYTGMELYEFVGKEEGKAYLGSVTTLVAGVPYIFRATATELAVYSDGTTADEAGSHNGLHGTFTDNTPVAVDNYILYDNAICKVTATCWVNANRAYIVWDEIPTDAPQQMPGRKYIGMDVTGENEATGFENITNGENNTIKVIENGQLIIIRNGEKYNVQGQRL